MTTIEKLFLLIQKFPTLWELSSEKNRSAIEACFAWVDGADRTPLTVPVSFAALEFASWIRETGMGHGENCAARFILSVWNPSAARDGAYDLPVFDLHEALGCWDQGHREAFVSWVRDPFWP